MTKLHELREGSRSLPLPPGRPSQRKKRLLELPVLGGTTNFPLASRSGPVKESWSFLVVGRRGVLFLHWNCQKEPLKHGQGGIAPTLYHVQSTVNLGMDTSKFHTQKPETNSLHFRPPREQLCAWFWCGAFWFGNFWASGFKEKLILEISHGFWGPNNFESSCAESAIGWFLGLQSIPRPLS